MRINDEALEGFVVVSFDGPARLSVADLAEVVFCTHLQPSEHPTPLAVRNAVLKNLRRSHDSLEDCAAHLATCYGDDPEGTCERMRWARSVAITTFLGRRAAA